jgi:pyruvate/2-oxoacid:ferredoxin oxidoreductase beta subunit
VTGPVVEFVVDQVDTIEIVGDDLDVEIVEASVEVVEILEGPAGPAGATGAQGPEGPQGPPGEAAEHTHVIADTTGLQAALDAKAASVHGHAIADTTGLQAALDAKAASSHGHAIADTTGLQGALDGKAASSHGHAIADVTGLSAALDGKADDAHGHAIADTTGLSAALDAKAPIDSPTFTGGASFEDSVSIGALDLVVLEINLSDEVDNLAVPAASIVEYTGDGYQVTGIAGGYAGRMLLLYNVDAADTFPLPHEHAGSDAANRLVTPTGDTFQIPPRSGVWAVYSAALSRWVVLGFAAIEHTHAIADVTGLSAALDGKADDAHGHAIADVTGLSAALDGKQPAIQFKDEGANEGTSGAVTVIDFVGDGVVADYSGGALTVTIAGGGGGGGGGNYTVAVTFDGQGAAIEVGTAYHWTAPADGTIVGVTMLADQSGSIVVDVYKDTFANYPPTNADSITAAAPPTISSAIKSQDTTLTGWTTAFSAGDVLRFEVESCSAITRCCLHFEVQP